MQKLIQRGNPIPEEMYLESLMYLESIKGFEQDAKKFLFMAKDSQDY